MRNEELLETLKLMDKWVKENFLVLPKEIRERLVKLLGDSNDI